MANTPLYMTHSLTTIPDHPLPDGFAFKRLDSREEREQWADITTAAGEFQTKDQALKRFESEFGVDFNAAKMRIIFLKTAEGAYAGTACAWYGNWKNETIGRLHWVEMTPDFQGHKLGRPLIAKALNRLSHYHDKAYLKTQSRSLAAIHLYLQFGFKPAVHTPEDRHAWDYVFTQLNKN